MYASQHCAKWRAPTAALLAMLLVVGLFVVLPFINHLDTSTLRGAHDPAAISSALRRLSRGTDIAAVLPGMLDRDRPPLPVVDAIEPTEVSVMPEIEPLPLPAGVERETSETSLDLASHVFDVSELDFAPVVLHRTFPEYPLELRRQGLDGRVVVVFRIDDEGRVYDVHIDEASHPEFAEAVFRAVLLWRFMPGTVGGKRVPFKMLQPVTFSISENAPPPRPVRMVSSDQ